MMRDNAWAVEQFMLNIYLTLVHRIDGLGLSLKDFWEMDTWTTSLFYLTELAIIEEEQKEYGGKGKIDPSVKNNPNVNTLYEEMFEDDVDDYDY